MRSKFQGIRIEACRPKKRGFLTWLKRVFWFGDSSGLIDPFWLISIAACVWGCLVIFSGPRDARVGYGCLCASCASDGNMVVTKDHYKISKPDIKMTTTRDDHTH